MNEFFYTYVLLSEKDHNFYVGFTKDLAQRYEQHCLGEVQSTKGRRPLKLIYYEACLSQNDALKREKYLKTHQDEEPLVGVVKYSNKNLIQNGIIEGTKVSFQPDSEYEFTVDGEKLYRMFTSNITLML